MFQESIRLTKEIYEYLRNIHQQVDDLTHHTFTRAEPGQQSYEGTLEEAIQRFLPEVTCVLDTSYQHLNDLTLHLSPAERKLCLLHHRELVLPFFLGSSFVRRCIDLPLGYAGDYLTTRMFLEDIDMGISSTFARLLTRYLFTTGPSKAHRGRLPWAHSHLWRVAGHQPAHSIQILSFACNSERVLREFVTQGGSSEITLCDHDEQALAYCQQAFKDIARHSGRSVPVTCVKLSASEVLRDATRIELLRQASSSQQYDVILVLGLIDYLRDRSADRIFGALATLLKPQGLLLVSSIYAHNPWRFLMESILNWQLMTRTRQELSRVVLGEPARFETVELLADETKANLYLAAQAHASHATTSSMLSSVPSLR